MHFIAKFAGAGAAVTALVLASAATASAESVIPEAPTVETSVVGNSFTATITNTNTVDSQCGVFLLTTKGVTTTQVFPTTWDQMTASWNTYPDPVLSGTSRTYTVNDLDAGRYAYYAGCTTYDSENAGWVNSPLKTKAFIVTGGGLFGSS